MAIGDQAWEKTAQINIGDLRDRMRRDPILWIENCLSIRKKTGELVPFRLNIFQKRLVQEVMKSVRDTGQAFFVVLKGRQLGISSVCRALTLWKAINYDGQNLIYSAHTADDTMSGIMVLKEMLITMDPRFPQPPPNIDSNKKIGWSARSTYIQPRLATGKGQGRSTPVNFAHITEVDYYNDKEAGCWERFKIGLLPAMKMNGAICIAESTCQGRKALYDLYQQSLQDGSRWKHVFFAWFENPEYVSSKRLELSEFEKEMQAKYGLSDDQINFWAEYERECGRLAALREYPFCIEDAFSVSGSRSIISADAIDASMSKPRVERNDLEPVVMGIDPSRLRDKTGIAIRQGKNMYEVLELPPFGNTIDLAELIAKMAIEFRVTVINCDSGNLGGAFMDTFTDMTGRKINGFDFGSTTGIDANKYRDRRAQMYDALRIWIASGGKLPRNDALMKELLSVELDPHNDSRLKLEKKSKTSSHSPNMADACALTMANGSVMQIRRFERPMPFIPWQGWSRR